MPTNVYFSLLMPYMTYLDEIWGNAYKTNCENMEWT